MRDRLTTLLYKLMMEHGVAPSTLENIMKTVEKEGFQPAYEEKGLAEYAEKLAHRLVPPIKRNTTAASSKRWSRCDCMEPNCGDCFPNRTEGE
jgi:hypothetical protein